MKNSKNSRNITKSFIRKSTPNSHEVKDAKYYEDAKENKYYVDGKNVLDNRVNGLKKQANNFIFDISNTPISIKEIKNQIDKLYESPNRKWINKIMLIKNQKLICIYIRKKD